MVRLAFAALMAAALAVCHVQVHADGSCECADWAEWSECSADCEHGTQTRERKCTYAERYAINRDEGEAREGPIDHSVNGDRPHSIEGGSYANDISKGGSRPIVPHADLDTSTEPNEAGDMNDGQGGPINHAVKGDRPHSIATQSDQPAGQYRTYPEGTVLDSPHSMENIQKVQGDILNTPGIQTAGDEYIPSQEYAPSGSVRDHSIRGNRPHSIPMTGEEDNSQSGGPSSVDHSVRGDRPHSVAIVDDFDSNSNPDLDEDSTVGFTDTTDPGISNARRDAGYSVRGGRAVAHGVGRRSAYPPSSYGRYHSGPNTQTTDSSRVPDRGSQMQCMAWQVQRRPCNTHVCGSKDPVTCHCTAWSAYSPCTQPCSPNNTHVRQRVCVQGSNGGLSCEALGLEMEQEEACSGSECAAGRMMAPGALTEPARIEDEGGSLRTLWFAIPAGIVGVMLVVASTVTVVVVVKKSRERKRGTHSVRVPILDVERESCQDLVRGCVSSESIDTVHI
eukprot:comp23023_c0_seq1/m.36763 comp23023_c0_seq1/g.36763  ORF comp23023_c0_seq1/g.36763 comp23023_c0_seq1/m.36763 type:complete len:505 (-) comp23023_c0_seq1:644-2158(-)